MQPSKTILDAIQTLLAADPATLAPVALAMHVHLAKAPFTPSPNNVIGDFTEADFDGAAQLNSAIGAQLAFTDGSSGLRVVQVKEPLGGWHWQVTGATDLTQTVYGWFLTDNADAVVYGCALLAAPVVMNAIGVAVEIPNVRFTFVNGSPF